MNTALTLLESLKLEGGRRWGDACTSWQRETARTMLDPDAPPFRWESRPRSGSKTTDAAALVITLALAQLPPGSFFYGFAVDQDQAEILIKAIAGFTSRTPELGAHVDLANNRVTFSNRTTFEALAADAASTWGLKPALIVADEVCQWPTTRNAKELWEAMFSSLGKVPGAKLLCITTSGDPAHWTRKIYETALTSPMWSVADIPGLLPWVSSNYLDEQRRMLSPAVFARLHMNEWTSPDDRLTNLEDLRACVAHRGSLPPQPGVQYVIGVDLAVKVDNAVAAVCHAVKNAQGGLTVVLDHMEVWEPSKGRLGKRRQVDLETVRGWLSETALRYNHALLVFDPAKGEQMIPELKRQGLRVEEDTFTPGKNNDRTIALYTAIQDHRLALPDDEALIDELANVTLRESSPNVLRMDHVSGRHDDRATAVSLSNFHLTRRSPSSGTPEEWKMVWEHRSAAEIEAHRNPSAAAPEDELEEFECLREDCGWQQATETCRHASCDPDDDSKRGKEDSPEVIAAAKKAADAQASLRREWGAGPFACDRHYWSPVEPGVEHCSGSCRGSRETQDAWQARINDSEVTK
ncbi:MAG TPA: hypothetical protein VFC30_06600 [Solirubrobacteraceae bacterium]|nr:hypothetical protein [Solirubrobacteraceae bacterium]